MLKWYAPLLLLSGCLSMKTDNVAKVPSLEGSTQQALESPVFSKGSWPKEEWWKDFGSNTLCVLVQEALSNNPSLQSVENSVEQARQMSLKARSKLLPTLFFTADDNWRYLSEHGFTHLLNPSLPLNGYQVDLSLAFQYEFDFFGKYRNQYRAAVDLFHAQIAELAQSKLILATSLSQSYLALVIQNEKYRLYEQIYLLRKSRWDLQEKVRGSALASLLPTLAREEDVEEAQQWLLDAEQEVALQKHLINILAGRGPDAPFEIEPLSTIRLLPLQIPDCLALELLSRRPDLIAQLRRVEALAHEVGAAKADFFPNINLTSVAGLASIAFSNLFTAGSRTFGVDPALSLPIFTGGSIRASVQEKKALFEEAVCTYNALILAAAQEVSDVFVYLKMAFARKQAQDKSLHASSERLALTELRKDKGLDSEFPVLAYREEHLRQQIQDLEVLYDQYVFTVRLIKALGGGYEVPR